MKLFTNKLARNILISIAILAVVFVGYKLINKQDLHLIKAGKHLDSYNIIADFNPKAKSIECSQIVNYTNRTGSDLTHIYFHLYPNAFKFEGKSPFNKEEMERAYPNGFSKGFIQIDDVFINDYKANFIIEGDSENLLMLLIDGSLQPNKSINVTMHYTVVLPNCMGRFGYGENTYKAANWYPIASVYDKNGWNLDPYYSIGDPFYSNAANYSVNITAPADYTIASTGDLIKKARGEDSITWTIKATAVRDFAWLASNKFKVAATKVDGITVSSYYFKDEPGSKALDYAVAAMGIFNKAFGKYPYKQLSVVESDFFIGGMEYPNLIMIDHSLYSKDSYKWLELITVHEAAHQWWYGVVGNNQIMDAWVDEGLTEYSTVMYYGLRYGAEKEEEMYRDNMAEGKYLFLQDFNKTMNIDESIHRPIFEFPDWYLYDVLVYGKAAMMFHQIREEIGDELFFEALRKYYHSMKFKIADKDDIIRAFNKTTGQGWEDYFNKWLYNLNIE